MKAFFAPSLCSAGELTLGESVSAETEFESPLVVSGGPNDLPDMVAVDVDDDGGTLKRTYWELSPVAELKVTEQQLGQWKKEEMLHSRPWESEELATDQL
jgi:hypothetical protein